MTTIAEEQTLLAQLALSGRCAVDQIGTSVEGRPVQLLRMGIPPPAATDRAALLHVGGQHGNEPAPREGLLEWAHALVDAGPYLDLTGTSGDYASTPHTAVLGITGDLDLRAEAAVDDWGAGIQTLIGKYVTTGNERAYRLTTTSPSGFLRLYWSTDGSSFETRDSTVAIDTVAANGTRVALRATLDVDNGASGHTVRFWWAPYLDGADWQLLGDPVVTAGTTSIFNATGADLELGSSIGGTGNLWSGRLWAAEVRDGIDGTVVADPRLQEQTLAASGFADDAGRTWTVQGSAAIASILTSAELDFLASTGVLLIPTMNPDGIDADTRENADDVDLNRDHIALSEPETQAVASVQQTARPAVTFDQHETTLSRNDSNDITFMPTTSITSVGGMVDQAIVDLTDDILTALRARCTTEGWSDGDWTTVGDERRLTRMAWLRHSAAIVVETTGLGGSPQPLADRIAQHRAMAEEALTFCAGTDPVPAADTSIANVIAAGAAGTAPFNIRTEIIDPPPVAYRMTGLIPNLHLELHGITRVGDTLSMAQAAYPVIPFLWDTAAQFSPFVGVRLLTLATPAVVATVQEFAEVLSGSHKVVVEARVLTSFQSGNNPTGTEIPIIGGEVTFDATAEIWSDLDLETVGIDEATGASWFPRFPDSLLAPYGNEIFVRRGVDTGGGGKLWSPLGYFRIEAVEQQGPHSTSAIRITGQDRMGGLVEAELVSPREYAETVSFGAVFADLVGDVYPDAVIAFDDTSAFQQIGRRLIADESRYEPLLEMADSLGKVIYFDGEGVLRVESPPEDDDPVWRVAAGKKGVMLSSSRRVTRQGAFNAVVVQGEGGGGDDPVLGVAVDAGPESPTRWGGRFGRVPRVEALPQVTTASQAAEAARQILRRNLGAPYSADFTAKPNPALRPRMPGMVAQKDGNREVHVIETVTIPLAVDGNMPATTRERTHVVIGAVIS